MTARAQTPAHSHREPSRGDRGPFPRPVDVRRLPEEGLSVRVEATPAECAALAADIGLPAVGSLDARFELRRRAGGRVAVTGEVAAEVTQHCVVTLDPFTGPVRQSVDLLFAPAVVPEGERTVARRGRRASDDGVAGAPVPGSDDQADPPDPIIDDTIDLGAVAAEFVALALDPYPRSPGASFDDVIEKDAAPSAFAALERLKAQP